jgi:hypothetical protein
MENSMCKSSVTLAAVVAILSIGAPVSAQASGATSAPSKYDNADQSRTVYRVQAAGYTIAEFSSSST